MAKFTKVQSQVVFKILPVSFNLDGSISATVTYGVTEQPKITDESGKVIQGGTMVNPIATQQHYFQPDEAAEIMAATANDGESLNDFIDRVITDVLVNKGALNI